MRILCYILTCFVITSLFSSCATIAGGSQYWAKVQVNGHPNAKIEYEGIYEGTGDASFKVKRSEADQLTIKITEDGCETETKKFTQRTFRGWAFVGTIITWTGLSINGGPWIPIPFGVIVDGATGAWWKPEINEKGVSKQDYKHFMYQIDYTGCDNKTSNSVK